MFLRTPSTTWLVGWALWLGGPTHVTARAETPQAYSQGYVYVAPIVSSFGVARRLQAGAGGDVILGKGFGLSGDVGWLLAREGFGLASVNGTYNLPGLGRDGRVVPFVSGGYSVAFRESSLSLFNFGGGFTHWFREQMGFRFEARYHDRKNLHSLVTLRVGLSFR